MLQMITPRATAPPSTNIPKNVDISKYIDQKDKKYLPYGIHFVVPLTLALVVGATTRPLSLSLFLIRIVQWTLAAMAVWALGTKLLQWRNARIQRCMRAMQDRKSGGVPRIRGLGSAVPSVDGCPGFQIPTRWICEFLREECGIHNPKSKKPLADDWAERYLRINSVAFGSSIGARNIAAGTHYIERAPDDLDQMEEIDEMGLAFRAFDQAIENARIAVQDIDVLIHASCTSDDVHFYEGMRVWYEQYPTLSKKLIPIFMPVGCPVLVHALKLSQNLLASQDINNVAIVVSNCVSKHFDKQNLEAYTKDNDLLRWLNALIFGDAGFSCILSTSTENLPERTYRLVDAEIRCDPDIFIAGRKSEVLPGSDKPAEFFTLNPYGTKEIPSSLQEWLGWLYKNHGYSMDSFEHIVFHQANPNVIGMVCERFGCTHKTALVGMDYGNQGGCSIGVALHQRLEKSESKPKHGEKVLGYALGALLGNSHGVFVLECEVRDGDDASNGNTESSSLSSVDGSSEHNTGS